MHFHDIYNTLNPRDLLYAEPFRIHITNTYFNKKNNINNNNNSNSFAAKSLMKAGWPTFWKGVDEEWLHKSDANVLYLKAWTLK